MATTTIFDSSVTYAPNASSNLTPKDQSSFLLLLAAEADDAAPKGTIPACMYRKLDKARPFAESGEIAVVSKVAAVPGSGPDAELDRVVVPKRQVALVVELDGIVGAKVAEKCIVDHSMWCGTVLLQGLPPASHRK